MRIKAHEIQNFTEYTRIKMTGNEEKSPLTEKLLAAWLKHDPFVKLISKDNETIHHDVMLALAGEKAAKRFYKHIRNLKPRPKLVYPRDVREKEQDFLDKPQHRTRIVRELVYWGTDEYLNSENPDSHSTRMQIVNSLLGPILINSSPEQEKLIIDGLKVIIITRRTSLGKNGETSPLVHQEILDTVCDLLRYNQIVKENLALHHTHVAMRSQLIKTIQNLKERSHHSAYYVADDRIRRQRSIAEKFPLKDATYRGLIEIVRHYTFSAWPDFRTKAQDLLVELKEA